VAQAAVGPVGDGEGATAATVMRLRVSAATVMRLRVSAE
jgi:hypothetical protein